MHKELFPLLNAYLDGELHGLRLTEMERHLETCEICRNELNELRRVSELLRNAPAPQFTPAERFSSNLVLRLPRRDGPSQSRSFAPASRWLVPAGLLGVWFFLQATFTLINLVHVADLSGLLATSSPWLSTGSTQTAWFAATTDLLGGQLGAGASTILSTLNGLNVFGLDLFEGLLWQAGLLLTGLAWYVFRQIRGGTSPSKIDIKA